MIVDELKKSILDYAMRGKISRRENTDRQIIDKLVFDKNLCEIDKNYIPFNIPSTWKWIKVGNLGETSDTESFADGPFGSNLKTQHYTKEKEVRIIQLSNVTDNGWCDDNVKYTTYEHLKTIARCEVHPGDFVIAKMMPAGRPIIMPNLGTRITLGSDVVKFVPNSILNKQYILYAFKSPMFIKQVYAEVHGITRVRTSLTKLKNCIIPLPPLEEQQRIVDKIEELFAKLGELKPIEEELNELKKNFPGEMRKAILNSAFSGEFTGLEGKCFNTNKLTEVCDEIVTGNSIPEKTKKEKYISKLDGYCYIGTKDLDFNHIFDYDNGVKIPYDEPNFRYADSEDVLMCIEGGSAGKKIGIIDRKVCYGNKLCRFHANKNEIMPRYLYYFLQSPCFLNQFNTNMSGIIGGVSINKIKNIEIKYPSLEEQQRIVDKLEQLLPLCDDIENIIGGKI